MSSLLMSFLGIHTYLIPDSDVTFVGHAWCIHTHGIGDPGVDSKWEHVIRGIGERLIERSLAPHRDCNTVVKTSNSLQGTEVVIVSSVFCVSVGVMSDKHLLGREGRYSGCNSLNSN